MRKLTVTLIFTLLTALVISSSALADPFHPNIIPHPEHYKCAPTPSQTPKTKTDLYPYRPFPGAGKGKVHSDIPGADTNPHIISWLYMPDTKICFPVTRLSDYEDLDNPYISRDYAQNVSRYGALFQSKYSDDDTTIIFGSMTRELDKFRDVKYIENHSEILLWPHSEGNYSDSDVVKYQVAAVYIYRDNRDLNGDGCIDYQDYFGLCHMESFIEFTATYNRMIYRNPFLLDPDGQYLFLQAVTLKDKSGDAKLYGNHRIVVMAVKVDE